MSATPRRFSLPDVGPPFEAKYPGECYGCGNPFDSGTTLRFKDGNVYINHDCSSDGAVYVTEGRSDGREPINVMPPGKTVRDACTSCFTIHTDNQVECS